MPITIETLRAAGLSQEQLLRVLEIEQNETRARLQQQSRLRSRLYRANKKANKNNDSVTSVTRDVRDVCGGGVLPPSRLTTDATFEEFWRAYPKRAGSNPKQPALAKFRIAVRNGADPQAIIVAARRYAEEVRKTGKAGTEYVAQTVTWLNQQRWTDYGDKILPLFKAVGPTAEDLRMAEEGRKLRENCQQGTG